MGANVSQSIWLADVTSTKATRTDHRLRCTTHRGSRMNRPERDRSSAWRPPSVSAARVGGQHERSHRNPVRLVHRRSRPPAAGPGLRRRRHPARRPVRGAALGDELRQGRAAAVGLPLLLLVPAGVGVRRVAADLHRLPTRARHRPHPRPADRPERAMIAAASTNTDGVALSIVVVLFLAVTVLGFAAARWRRAESLANLDEWGLGGRGFGTFVTWFLLGGDLYTAYTFIAVPALMFAAGALGFFAVPYTIIVYPLVFLFLPRLWSVSHRHGYVTPADFVRGRCGSRGLALAIAITGLLATMPYIALQLVGIQAVLEVMGVGGSGN